MRQQMNYQEWDPDDVEIGAGGRAHTNRDDEWERDVRHWDSRGVPDELMALARPLMEGTERQGRQAERLLSHAENTFQMQDGRRRKMAKLLIEHGKLGEGIGYKEPTADELVQAWEDSDPMVTMNRPIGVPYGDTGEAWETQYDR